MAGSTRNGGSASCMGRSAPASWRSSALVSGARGSGGGWELRHKKPGWGRWWRMPGVDGGSTSTEGGAGKQETGECLEAGGREASTRESEPGVGVVCRCRGQEIVTRWGGGRQERKACWRVRLTVADGGAQESGRVLREGKQGVTGGTGVRSMYQRELEAEEASPRRGGAGGPSPRKGTRANATSHLQKSSESEAVESEANLRRPAGGVVERRQGRVTRSSPRCS